MRIRPGSTSAWQCLDVPEGSAGNAYLSKPESGPGPGVLFLHSWWGLTDGVKDRVEALADEGFSVLVPNLLPGDNPTEVTAAVERLATADIDATAALILSSIVALRAHSVDPEAPVGVVGQSMGASWALWVATRQPDSVAAAVAHYGVQNIDFSDLTAPVLCHFAELDPIVSEDSASEMQAHMRLLDKSVAVHRHSGARHFFAESGVEMLGPNGVTGERNDIERRESDLCWESTAAFLHDSLDSN